ncbi:MAG: sulfite exporter TauE/SafE family protein [Anaerolineae bacterium]
MEQSIFIFILVGFIAQMIDGALGMAYGVSASTFLLSLGVSPLVASASVHAAEIFTTAVSGTSHYRLGNVDKALVKKLAIPGVLGAVLGAYILTAGPGDKIKPLVSAYQTQIKHIPALALAGGFLDVCGGGGWGPVVTTTLVANGSTPRTTIGSVNLTEFFVTAAASVTFVLTIGLDYWQVIVGLAIGGAVAAPLAARICQRLPQRTLMFLVGLVIIGLSIRTLASALG